MVAPAEAAREIVAHVGSGGGVGILFGRERYGLQNEEVALANRIITFPVNPGFASLNLAQAVLLIGYEWFKLSTGGALPFAMPERSEPASQHQMQAFFDNLVRELDKVEFLRPRGEARDHAGQPAQHLHPDGPDQAGHAHAARGGDGDRRRPQGPGQGRRARWRTGDTGCARCWPSTGRGRRCRRRQRHRARARPAAAAKPDRCRTDPVAGADHATAALPDSSSARPRSAATSRISSRSCTGSRSNWSIANESEAIVADRAGRQAWLEARDYRVIEMRVGDVEGDLATELERLEASLLERG